jgi:hypothetical protein
MLRHRTVLGLLALFAIAGGLPSADKADEWIMLFNGKDLSGWKLRQEKTSLKKIVDADGKVIAGAKQTKLDQTETVVDAKNQPIKDAKVAEINGKRVAVDAKGEAIKDAKINKSGGRDAIVDKDGKELKEAKIVMETVPNEIGWEVSNGELVCTKPHGGNDIYTEKKFTDFELHVEFQAWSNSGVYLQGRYEIQVDNDFNVKPKVVEKDGKKVEVLPNTMCGAIYGRIPPSKNMGKPPKEWQSYDVVFKGGRGTDGKVTQKARVTLVWNGEKVIDNAEIEGPTGAALDGKVAEPGPLLLQGDHGKVAYRNIKIKPIEGK